MIIGVDIRPLMEREPTGVSWHLVNLLGELFAIDRDNQYKLFYNSFHNVQDRLPRWSYPNVKFYGFRWPNKILNSFFLFLGWPHIDEMLGGCDIFIIPNLCYFSLSSRCRQIAIIHDLSFALYRDFFKTKWRFSYWLISARKMFNRADKLVAVSENTKADLLAVYGVAEEKIKVIYSGMNHENTKTRKHENKLNLPERFILTLGTREPRKNLAGVILAFEKIKLEIRNWKLEIGNWISKTENQELNLNLVIAGGAGWLNAEVDQLIKKSRFKDDIKILGYVSEAEKEELYRRAEVFIYPSFYEGFGFPPLEAMSCGCPVITSLSSATSEICGGAAILVDPYNIEELIKAISELGSRSSDLGVRLIKKGYERVKFFSWEKTAQEFLKIINELSIISK